MSVQNQHLESLQDIRQLMQKSSRFISLSGLSGIAAGLCALIAAWVTHGEIKTYAASFDTGGVSRNGYGFHRGYEDLQWRLVIIAAITFGFAFVLAFLFTWLRSKKTGVPIWGFVARKVMVSVTVPMVIGGLVILRLMHYRLFELIAPCCLIFYGLGLINASKYVFTEIRFLGYGQLLLGALNLWLPGYGLYFWALGFGVLHIVYGYVMWWKYERKPSTVGA